jgi:integrase/recombinase XerC
MVTSFLSYLEHTRRVSKHTLVAYRTDLAQFAQYCLQQGVTDISEASRIETRGWLISLSEQGAEAKSIARKQACLRSFFKFLITEGKREASDSPVLHLPSPRIPKRNPQFFSETEMDLVFANVPSEQSFANMRDTLVLELLYGTGIRLAELVALPLQALNRHNNTLNVFGKRSKERIVPIHKQLMQMIDQYLVIRNAELPEAVPYLIVTDKGKVTYPMFIQRIVTKYSKGINTVEQHSPHTIRHSFATHLLDNGAELNAIKSLLGHTSLAATQVYTHNSLQKIRSAYSKAHPRTGTE